MCDTKKALRWKIIRLNEVDEFSIGHFLTRCILCFYYKKTLLKMKNSIFNQNMRFEISVEMQNRLLC